MMASIKQFSFLMVAIAAGVAGTVMAAVPPEKAIPIDKNIEDELAETINRFVDEKSLAARFGFEYPIHPPKMTLAAVESVVDDQVRLAAVKKYPNSWVQDELEKQRAIFEVWAEGDKVTGMTKDGKEFSGWLRLVSHSTIQVNARKIRKDELAPETLVHVDDRRAMAVRQQTQIKLKKSLVALRQRYGREIRLEKVREVYHNEGYIRVMGQWRPKLEFFQERVAEEKERYKALLVENLIYKHYYQGGYRLFEGEWYTPEEVAKLRTLALVAAELEPDKLMAEFDIINREGLVGVQLSDTAKAIFDDDGDDDAGADPGGGDEF